MSYKTALIIIFIISIAGLLFSGYLSYYELWSPNGCADAVISCGTKSFTIADLPACVYGFVMYLVIFGISGFSLIKNKINKK